MCTTTPSNGTQRKNWICWFTETYQNTTEFKVRFCVFICQPASPMFIYAVISNCHGNAVSTDDIKVTKEQKKKQYNCGSKQEPSEREVQMIHNSKEINSTLVIKVVFFWHFHHGSWINCSQSVVIQIKPLCKHGSNLVIVECDITQLNKLTHEFTSSDRKICFR